MPELMKSVHTIHQELEEKVEPLRIGLTRLEPRQNVANTIYSKFCPAGARRLLWFGFLKTFGSAGAGRKHGEYNSPRAFTTFDCSALGIWQGVGKSAREWNG